MNQLTTTTNNNHFTLETSIMEKILDASGYNFHVLTIEGHRYWIGRELVHAFGFTKNRGSMNMFHQTTMDRKDIHTIQLTNANGLKELKKVLYESVWSLNSQTETNWTEIGIKKIPFLSIVREDTLQQFLTLYTRKPDAKEIGNKIYEVLASGNPVFDEKVLDDWGTSIDELQKTVPQLFDASKKVNGFIFGLVRNDKVAGRIVQGYHNTTMSNFIFNVDTVRRNFKEMGVSSTLLSSRRNLLAYLNFVSRQVISFIDDMFIKEVTIMVNDWKSQGFTDRQISLSIFKKKDKNDKPIVQMVNFVIEKYSHVIKTLYWMDEEGMMKEKKEQFMNSQYVTNNDRQIHGRLVIEDWSAKKLLDKTIHKLIEKSEKEKVS